MAFKGPLEDRIAIRDLMGAYADATFRQDVEAWLACFTQDAVRAQGAREVRGTVELRAMWDKVWSILDRMAFFTEVGAIEVDGDRATARAWCREILFLKGGGVRKVVGVYDDLLLRQDGGWRFARRTYQLFMDEAAEI